MNIPSKLILTCKVTGKTVTWTNKSIIAKKIEQHGSLEAFTSQYVSKGANKKEKTNTVKPVQKEEAVSSMTKEEYDQKYTEKTFTYNDGTNCTVSVPKVG